MVLRIRRPRIFFTRRMPEYVEIVIRLPKGFKNLEEWRLAVTEAADRKEAAVREDVARGEKRFKSKREILKTDPFDNPWGTGRSDFVPFIAAKNKETRDEASEQLEAFRLAYDMTLAAFREGNRSVVWPYGTYKMRRIYDCPCAGPP